MKHRTIITRLCYSLGEGHGINSALAELGLTTTFLTKRLRRSDRRKLHQAAAIYRESLQCEIIQRARLGRATGQLERALDNLPPLDLPGDAEDEERASRRSDIYDDAVIVDVDDLSSFTDFPGTFGGPSDDVEDEDEGEGEDEGEDAPAAPSRRLQANSAPSALESPHPVEEPHQRRPQGAGEDDTEEPEPEPRRYWRRLFTGRAQLLDEDGTVVRSVMPGAAGYPHESEFVNWN